MQTSTIVTSTFHCSLERAFKTPILGDATKILITFGGYPLVIGFNKDETWGNVGGRRVPIANSFLFIKSQERGLDVIFERDENKYWKWGVSDLGILFFFATHNCGEWWVNDNSDGTIAVQWKYTWFSRNILTHPINWLFVKIFWRNVMKNGMENIQQMAETETPYIYNK
jgi:hypothetical protein